MKLDLRSPLLDANLLEFQAVMEQADEPSFSTRYRKSCIRMLSAPKGWARRLACPVWKKALQTAACILLTLSLTMGVLMGVSPTVRAAVRNWVRELTGETIIYQTTVHGVPVETASMYRPAELPTGWKVSRLQSDGYDCQWNCKNGDAWLMFRCTGPTRSEETNGPGASQSVIHTMDEVLQNSCQTLTIQGCTAAYYQDETSALLTWENREGLLFWLRASGVDLAELVKIAENIRLYQGPALEVHTNWLPEGYRLNQASVASMGDSGQLEWRQERNAIACIYSGAAPLLLPDGPAESVQLHGTEGRFWSAPGKANDPTLMVDGTPVGGNSVQVGGDCTVTVGSSSAVDQASLSWTDPDTGITFCLSGPVDQETLLQMAEHLYLEDVS